MVVPGVLLRVEDLLDGGFGIVGCGFWMWIYSNSSGHE